MNQDELKAKASEIAASVWAKFCDDWKENTVIAVVFLLIGYALKTMRG